MKKLWNKWYVKWGVRLIALGLIFIILLVGSVYFGFWGKLPTKSDLKHLSQAEASLVLDRDSTVIGRFYKYNRESISFDDLSPELIHALIATEDARFYEHNGIDWRSFFRVFFKTILLGDESSGGGSTITQQLAKNIYGRRNYGTFGIVINKIRECITARRIEKIYTKKEILVLYLNTVPFSGNTYGIESVSEKYFGVDAKNLSTLQAATLIGTLKANYRYDPFLHPKKSKKRRNTVLSQMVKYHYLKKKKADSLKEQPIQVSYLSFAKKHNRGAYFKQEVEERVRHILSLKKYQKPDGSSYNLLTDGLKIYTTLDADLQKAAESAMKNHLAKLQHTVNAAYGKNAPWKPGESAFQTALHQTSRYQKLKKEGISKEAILDSLKIPLNRHVFSWKGDTVLKLSFLDSLSYMLKYMNAGLVSLAPENGAILAYIGGIDFEFFKYDHVVQSKRQVGSTFKPFVYTTAIEEGVDPCKYYSVRPVTYTDQGGWKPTNAESKKHPYMNYPMETALSKSLNTVAVKVLRDAGISSTIEMVHNMGITSSIPKVPSIALGVADVRLIEMAKAYTCYLNNGVYSDPFFIKKIVDKNGNTIYQHEEKKKRKPAFSERTCQIMLEMLQDVVNNGTGRRLRYRYHLTNELAGKTGTTQNNTDGWFVGLMPHLVTVVWVGNDNPQIKFKTTRIGQGANSALPIFAGMVQKMNKNPKFNYITKASFPNPSAEVKKVLDCARQKKSGFFKRLFQKKNPKKKFKKKKGFFYRLFHHEEEEEN